MKKLFLILILFLFVACKKEISISMVTATSMQNGLPFLALNDSKWMPEANAEFVKFHVYLDEAVQLSKVEVNSCGDDFKSRIDMYINFDEMIQTMKEEGRVANYSFATPVTARSVTFNFSKNSNICLSSVHLYDEKGKQFKVKSPRIIEGTAVASETGKPEASYGVMNLFDSRYEYSYASLDNSKGVSIDFTFKDEQKIKSIKVWNGYQRSDVHCVENGRVKTINLTGDDGYSEKITLKDEMGPQVVELPKLFSGRNLKMTVDESYRGKKYKGIVLSELRFFDGKEWFLLDPFSRIREIATSNEADFDKAALSEVMNKSLTGNDPNANNNWTVRLRSDGSMFMDGRTTSYDENSENTSHFYALGNYEVKSAENNILQIRIFGFLREIKSEIEMQMDCNGCGRDCNTLGSEGDPNKIEKIFAEFLEIQKVDGKYVIKNLKRSNHLNFDTLDMNLE
ncbi:MAG TPA: hypothetical protein PLX69_20380 [Leptospiraceae bacterium]|nr:hypothetical protein [Leptospiraceae bacterium]HRG76927.1 hypothetical protein [Leptospiraceae bacterium]